MTKPHTDASPPAEQTSVKRTRANHKLEADLGIIFLTALKDPLTVELMLNSDGTLWQEKLGQGMVAIDHIPPVRAESILRTIAGYHDKVITLESPLLECEFPLDGSRFAGQAPPVVPVAAFSLRKKAVLVYTLDDYVKQDILTPAHHAYLTNAVESYKNILVIGGTGSGKTTLINALIAAMVAHNPSGRPIIIEDTGELQCTAKNQVSLHTTSVITMTHLLRAALRMRPDRIIVGEVRGPESLDMLDAWNTGHPGGAATLHANSALSGLSRLQSLLSRNASSPKPIEPLIAEAVNVCVHIGRVAGGRKIKEVLEITGFENGHYITNSI
jgi:type IV secretion system protein VirB11